MSSWAWARDASHSLRPLQALLLLRLPLLLWGKPSATPGQSLQQALDSLERGMVFIFWGPKSIINLMKELEVPRYHISYPIATPHSQTHLEVPHPMPSRLHNKDKDETPHRCLQDYHQPKGHC